MVFAAPVQATPEYLNRLVDRARSPHLFLSVYMPEGQEVTTTEALRIRLKDLLDEIQTDLEGTSWEEPFQKERRLVEDYMLNLRPGGPGLVILSSREAQEWHALWLPDTVEEHVRFGRGAYVLPLLDVLDEFEPIGVAVLGRDRARVMAMHAGTIAKELRLISADVPGRHSRGGWAAYSAKNYERHIQVHEREHLKRVLADLEALHRTYNFRRLFLLGPEETRAEFKPLLPNQLSSILVGEMPVDARATDHEVAELVLEAARGIERREEEQLVEQVVTRFEKRRGAVAGLEPTLWALDCHELHLLVLAGEVEWDGHYCLTCDLLLPGEDILCPRCSQRTLKVDLWEELPGYAMRHGVKVEIVHGEAASALWAYDGIGGLLKPVVH